VPAGVVQDDKYGVDEQLLPENIIQDEEYQVMDRSDPTLTSRMTAIRTPMTTRPAATGPPGRQRRRVTRHVPVCLRQRGR
jgi:hypothetical protein